MSFDKLALKMQSPSSDFFPYIVGPVQYNRAVKHSIECLQNQRINRYLT